MQAARVLSVRTNVDNPLFSEMSAAVRDAVRAAGQLQVAMSVLRYVDNGMAQSLAQESIVSAHRLLGAAARSAAAGTDMFTESPRRWS
jgi:hypothetical protein